MAFGGFFGGSGSNSSSNSSKPSTVQSPSEFSSNPDPTSSSSNPLFDASSSQLRSNPGSQTPQSSAEIKQKLMQTIGEQQNIANARTLITKVNENCFDHCVTAPGSSLSSKEQTCLSACMEKYMEGWNAVSKSYVSRLQREGAQLQGVQSGGGAGMF